jgi:hypothetical protein
MTGDYGISTSNQGKGIQAFIHRHYRLLTLAVVLVLLGAGIGLWVSLPASVAHPPIRKYSGKQFPPPVLSYPSLKKLDSQIAKITPPWKTMTPEERTMTTKGLDEIDVGVPLRIYYSTPLCTHLKVTMQDVAEGLENPFNSHADVTVKNLSTNSCIFLRNVKYNNTLVSCLPVILIYNNSGQLRYWIRPSLPQVSNVRLRPGSTAPLSSHWYTPLCGSERAYYVRPGHIVRDLLAIPSEIYYGDNSPLARKKVPPGTYAAVAALPLGYLQPICPPQSKCPTYPVFIYYSEPVTFTIK